MAQPKRKSSELLEQINRLTPQDYSNPFKLRSLLKDAEHLATLPNSTVEDKNVLGIVHALNFNTQQSDTIFKNILSQTPELIFFENYGISLATTHRPIEAINVLQQGLSLFPRHPALLEPLATAALEAGQLSLAKTTAELCVTNRLSEEELNTIISMASIGLDFLQQRDVSEEHFTQLINVLHQLLEEEKICNPANCHIQIQEDEESSWLLYELELYISAEKSVELDLKLGDRLIEADMLTGPYEHILVMTACAEPDDAS